MAHPFFWTTSKRLAFLQDASDRFEIEERDPPSLLLQELEANAATIIGTDWYKRIDRVVANDLGKYRKYDGKRVRDLLRALRNKVNPNLAFVFLGIIKTNIHTETSLARFT